MEYRMTRKEMLKLSGGVLASASLLGLAGCQGASTGGTSTGSGSGSLTLGNIGWTENVAIANLTKVLLQEHVGLKQVKTQVAQIGLVFEGVGSGQIDAFQDVWMPNHKTYLSKVKNDVEHLSPWYRGTTKYSMAVPNYMRTNSGQKITSIAQLNDTDATKIYGIEAGLPMTEAINNKAIPQYNLKQKQVISGTAGMLSELTKLYPEKKPFVFVAWSPHWMNQVYDFTYLQDPKGALGSLTKPSQLSAIVNKDLPKNNAASYAFLNAFTMDSKQLNTLEEEIRKANDDGVKGAKAWLKSNGDVVKPWVDAAKKAQK